MTTHAYSILDVFTDRPLSGNQLAVVWDADDLAGDAMQAIAREFNVAETVFILKAANLSHAAAVRIFTPGRELPFAGHPTVGAAVALAGRSGEGGSVDRLLVLEERIGPVRCVARAQRHRGYAEFDLPRLPERHDLAADLAAIAAALGLDGVDIGFENHSPSVWSAGVPFLCVPLRGLDAAGRVRVDPAAWAALAPAIGGITANAYVYCRETVHHDASFHVRMFAPDFGIAEDPATGSAAAAFAGAVAAFDGLADGPTAHLIEQGLEMGRPSCIRLELDGSGGALHAARIGGDAVLIAEGTLFA